MTTSATRLCHWFAVGIALGFTPGTSASTNTSSWAVRVWQSDDGLPNNQVTGLAQSLDGYLWVATYSRPARFDGVQFESFSPAEFPGGINDKTSALLMSRTGGLWLGMFHGSIVYMDSAGAVTFTNAASDKAVKTLIEDEEGALWIACQGGTIYRMKDGVFRLFTGDDGWPFHGKTTPWSLAKDVHGRIWFARSGHIGVFRQDRFSTLLKLDDPAATLTAARSGEMWICSASRLFKFSEEGELNEFGRFEAGSPGTVATALLEDRQGGVWIGTSDSGLIRYDGAGFESIPISGRHVGVLMEDVEGNIWAGTESFGLNRVRPRIVRMETADSGLPSGGVQSLCQDTSGRIWAAGRNGQLSYWTTGEWRIVETNGAWPGRVRCVAADETGAIWVGTRDRALHRWHDGELNTWRPDDGLIGREVRCLLVSKAGDVWIGGSSPEALQRLRNGRFDTFAIPPGVRLIRALAEDPDGNIWAGTSKGMLLKVSPDGTVTDETVRTTGPEFSIRSLFASEDGALWIGYADDGLGWFKNGRFGRVTHRHGLGDNTISQIVGDGEGSLWFGSNRGIFKVRRDELEAAAQGRLQRIHCRLYGKSEGLTSLEASTDAAPGALRSRDNRLWIPMRTGLAVVDAGKGPAEPRRPAVMLKQVLTGDQVVASSGSAMPVGQALNLGRSLRNVNLEPDHRRLRFEYTALSFAAPEHVIFRHRLEGFERDWVDVGTQRMARYPRLPPGKYEFRVQACNGDGMWAEPGASFAFTVAPFVWQTWWFRSLALVVLIAGTVGVVRYMSFRRLRVRLQSLEQQAALHRERARIARDMHDDLGGRLTEVELLAEMAQRAEPEQQSRVVQQLVSAARQAGESLDEIVWAVNPRHDNLPQFINYLGQSAIHFLNAAGIRCRVDFPEHPPAELVPPEVRHNLFLTVKEALNNVARHAHATEIWVRISMENGALNICVEDDGLGLQDGVPGEGADGLRNMRHRMEELGGAFQIRNRAHGGTEICLTLPWPPTTAARNGSGKGDHKIETFEDTHAHNGFHSGR